MRILFSRFKFRSLRYGLFLLILVLLTACGGSGGSGGNTTNSDTDGDGLSDADEINIHGTSPILADTDGDGHNDGREIIELGFDAGANNYKFNPLIADLPKFSLQIATVPKIQLNYTTTTNESQSYSNGSGGSNTTGSETRRTAGGSVTSEWGIEGTQSAGLFSTGVKITTSYSVAVQANYSWTGVQREQNTTKWSESNTYETSNSIQTSGGTLKVGVNLSNDGHIPYTIDNIIFSAMQSRSGADGLSTPVAQLNLDASGGTFPSTSLAPGGSIEGLIFSNNELHIDDAKALLRDSGSLGLNVSHAELLDADGQPLIYDLAEAQARTATIRIDYGFALEPEEYLVATNRNPDMFGETLADIFSILQLDVSVATTPWGTGSTFIGINSVRTVSNNFSTAGRWVMLHSIDSGDTQETYFYDSVLENYDPAAIEVNSGDGVLILYLKDEDGDGLGEREEHLLGTNPLNSDTDADGLTDYDEARGKSNWIVPYNEGYEVSTSPVVTDADADGLNDGAEKTKLTDPHKKDTDGDGILDDVDNTFDGPGVVTGPIISRVLISQKGGGIVATGQIQSNVVGANLTNVSIDWGDGIGIWNATSLPANSYLINEVSPPSYSYSTTGTYTVTVTSTDDVSPTFNTAIQTFDIDWKANINSPQFMQINGWHNGKHPRMVADVTGDGKDDLIGFGDGGVHVSPALHDGSGFATTEIWHDDATSTSKIGFGSAALYVGWATLNTAYDVRNVADVNNDGKVDIVVFGNDGVHVGISNGSTFTVSKWSATVGLAHKESPSVLGDIDGDGDADWIYFGLGREAYCHENVGANFANGIATQQFAYGHGWRVDSHPRTLADIDGDGKDDLVGFSGNGILVGLSNGDCTFNLDKNGDGQLILDTTDPDHDLALVSFSPAHAWWNSWDYPRIVKDINGDGKADIIGFGDSGVHVSLNTSGIGGISFGPAQNVMDRPQFSYDKGWRSYYGRNNIETVLLYGLVPVSRVVSIDRYHNVHPRTLADVDGDGDLDIVGFAGDGVGVGLNDGEGRFTLVWHWTTEFNWASSSETGVDCGLTHAGPVIDQPDYDYTCNNNWYAYRATGDINGDGAADLIGYGSRSVLVVPGISVTETTAP